MNVLNHPAARVTEVLYHWDAPSNSTRILDPGGIGPLVRSSIIGSRGTINTAARSSCERLI